MYHIFGLQTIENAQKSILPEFGRSMGEPHLDATRESACGTVGDARRVGYGAPSPSRPHSVPEKKRSMIWEYSAFVQPLSSIETQPL